MFTGLIENLGKVIEVDPLRFEIACKDLVKKLSVGASVSVNGVCLTVTKLTDASFTSALSIETLERTALSTLKTEDAVNLELPLQPASFLGGHFVQGHVDACGTVEKFENLGKFIRIEIAYPAQLAPYFVEKGSVAIDGVSLTINRVFEPRRFEVMIIPHTLEKTTIQFYKVGKRVNLETDILAKYVQRALTLDRGENKSL